MCLADLHLHSRHIWQCDGHTCSSSRTGISGQPEAKQQRPGGYGGFQAAHAFQQISKSLPPQASAQLARSTHRSRSHVPQAQQKPDKGLGVLEWTGKLLPQGLLVKGAPAAFPDGLACKSVSFLSSSDPCLPEVKA